MQARCNAVGMSSTKRALLLGKRPTPALDGFSNGFVAYAMRRLRTDYVGSCLLARRASDNATQDIGFTAGGWLDTAALLSFCGAGSGFVQTQYDQFGSARDATNTTNSQQPRIVNTGVLEVFNGRPAMRFDGVDDYLSCASVVWPGTDQTIFVVTELPTTSAVYQVVVAHGAGNELTPLTGGTVFDWATNGAITFGNGASTNTAPRVILATPGFNDGLLHQHVVTLAAAACSWKTDGATKTPTAAPPATITGHTDTLWLGRNNGGTVFRSGYLSELVIFSAVQSAQPLAGNQKSAFSTP